MKFPPLTGDASRRIHGVRLALVDKAATADIVARRTSSPYEAAAFRGKRKAYLEAAAMIEFVERGGRIKGNRRWRERKAQIWNAGATGG